LLDSTRPLNACTYILDSGSTDQTLNIAASYGAAIKFNEFINHPKQWNVALETFKITTPWVICLDADQILSPDLFKKLDAFKDQDYSHVSGIYFNRKNYFKGKWIRHGGYYPKYLLKMFRYTAGYSDLSEHMDHRFQIAGTTVLWKTAHLIESNLKENNISFWITKHNHYSDLLADEYLQRKDNPFMQEPAARLLGSPNERNASLKNIWRHLPLYLRPFLYFIFRIIFQLGILDGRTGIMFHFLQGFWFRLIVDIKIGEKRAVFKKTNKISSITFPICFVILFLSIYSFHIMYISITTPGGLYLAWFDKHLNYISRWRHFYIHSSARILEGLGYQVHIRATGLSVNGHSGFNMVYSCLGYGVMSCFSAFVLSFPKPLASRIKFLIVGLIGIQLLNTLRLILLAIYYNPCYTSIDHHTIFNCCIYTITIISVYHWTNK
ncbi:MAG TPA: glycosyltransferase, partial [Pedobacter sp.]|nr:glycosyltransferase [Pedobacter sp.]